MPLIPRRTPGYCEHRPSNRAISLLQRVPAAPAQLSERRLAGPPSRQKAQPLSESLELLSSEAYPVPAHLERALRSDHEFPAQARRLEVQERAEALSAEMCELDLTGRVLLQERALVPLDVLRRLEVAHARLDLALSDLVIDARHETHRVDEALTDSIGMLAHMQRRRHAHRWGLLLQIVDPERDASESRGVIDPLLDDLELPADEVHREAFIRIHRRRPRGWLTPRWLRVLWHASGDPRAAHRAWMRKAIEGAARDGQRRPPGDARRLQEPQILALVAGARAAQASVRQLEVLRASLSGQTSPEIAVRLGISASTVRVHLKRAMDKVRTISPPEIDAALSAA